jgi:hypothetical protein
LADIFIFTLVLCVPEFILFCFLSLLCSCSVISHSDVGGGLLFVLFVICCRALLSIGHEVFLCCLKSLAVNNTKKKKCTQFPWAYCRSLNPPLFCYTYTHNLLFFLFPFIFSLFAFTFTFTFTFFFFFFYLLFRSVCIGISEFGPTQNVSDWPVFRCNPVGVVFWSSWQWS